jgi:pimeloyl-ACP methyl ester carboxylesterase
VLVPAFKAAIHGQSIVPADTHVHLQPSTFRSSGNYAVVKATVTGPNGQNMAVGMVLSRQGNTSPWQVASLAPATALAAYTMGPAENASLTVNRQATPGSCAAVPQGKTPVVFVHGLNEKPIAWGNTTDQASFIGRIGSIAGAEAIPFDYSQSSRRWVTDPNIGARLASTILCLAQKSGTKVVVVAHSMGGLALKEAFKEQPQVAKELGLVVTIATPNDGTVIDSAFLAGMAAFCTVALCEGALASMLDLYNALPGLGYQSDQVKALPDWPKDVPVYAIAGNIAPTAYTLSWQGLVAHQEGYSGSDTLVTTNSALHGNPINGLGGYREFNCATSDFEVFPIKTHAPCDHNALLSLKPTVQAVTEQVQRYLSRVSKPATTPSATATAHNPSPAQSTIRPGPSASATGPAPAGHCPSIQTFMAYVAVDAQQQGREFRISPAGRQCGNDDWSAADGYYCDASGGNCIPAVVVLRWTNGWEFVTNGTHVTAQDPACKMGPTWIRSRLSCP